MSDTNENRVVKESADVVLEEIWAVKENIAAECNNDVAKLFEWVRERQKESGRTAVNLQDQRQPQPQKP